MEREASRIAFFDLVFAGSYGVRTRGFPTAIETLGTLVGENERIGGSRAQHDLIEFTLLSACLRANRLGVAGV